MPLLTFDVDPTPAPPPPSPPRPIPGKKPWTSYIFVVLVVLVLLLPQPSILLLLVQHYLQALQSPWTFAFHLGNIHLITFFTFSSFIVCISRHPGPVSGSAAGGTGTGGGIANGKNLSGRAEAGNDREDGASDALLADAEEGQGVNDGDQPPEYFQPARWCRHCNAPKPERAHHCSICDICVLKMDHHCPWLANKCIGHRTYTNFVHFLFCTTLLSCYVAWLGGHTIYYFMTADVPIMTHKSTPLHALFLTFLGTVFAITMGAFFGYHVYLVATNQTTLENISPFLLLRYLPPPPGPGTQLSPPPFSPSVSVTNTTTTSTTATGTPRPSSTSPRRSSVSSATRFAAPYHFPPPVYHPPEEHELNYRQRRKVRRAHHRIRIYDLGWKKNLSEFLGLPVGWGWDGSADADEVVARRGSLKGEKSVWVKVKKWIALVVWGGYAHGDGRTFARNPEADGLLLRLAKELEVERIREREGR